MSTPDPYGPEWEKEFREKAEAQLKADEKIRAFFSIFAEDSVQNFITHYINEKVNWHRYADVLGRRLEEADSCWINLAAEHLEVIQQKKLFDLQCQWRAEEIILPGIEICFDFEIWKEDILNCPFLPPVTREEVNLYKKYLATDDADLMDDITLATPEWQEYTDLKEEWENGSGEIYIPEWYLFHNNNTSAGSYLLLPDIRGQKEEFYCNLFFDDRTEKENQKKKESPQIKTETKPSLYYYSAVENFVTSFEDRATRNCYKIYSQHAENNDTEFFYRDMLDVLIKAEETVPMLDDPDWREGLRRTVKRYKSQKIIEAMDDALAQYELTRSMNISFAESGRPFHDLREVWLNNILQGRQLNGDPADLNF